MDEFSVGTDISLSFPHTNNGTNLTLTGFQFQVLDSEGEILIDFTTPSGFNPLLISTTVSIGRAFNDSEEKIDVRQVNVKLITASGTFKQTIYYKLIGDVTQLTPMVDSFMTFPESVMMRAKLSESLKYFDALPDAIKAVALKNSFERLVKHKYSFVTTPCDPTGTDISAYNITQFKALPATFQEAIKKAQLVEANLLVENSPVRDKIRDGIISETIGESSMFFRQSNVGANTKYPNLSDEAYYYIRDWLWRNATNAQIWKIRRA
jgi:hypothetical protein